MPTNLLSAAECKNANSQGSLIRKLHDGDGLYLWVYLDGRKYWRMRYWQPGKEKSLSIGVYPRVSLSDARKKRDELRKQLEAGLDPSAERKAVNLRKKLSAENFFEAVATEWYLKRVHILAPRHAQDVQRRLKSNIFPLLGKRPIDQIEAPELLSAIRVIEARGSYDLAHRVLQVCGQVFRYGIATGRCTRNLSADLRGALTPHVKRHQAAIRSVELPDLLRSIAKYEETGDKQTRLALELLALTFVRTKELIGAEWSEFDLDNAIWVVPAERMKMKTEHIVPLSRQSMAKLGELREISDGFRYVFPGKDRSKSISNNTMLFALYRLGYKGKMTGHGFRTLASTLLNEAGFKPDVVERQLAHCERNHVRGAYNRAEYLPERKRMMQHWADHLDLMLMSGKTSAVPFQGSAA
jgi:integrase